MKLRINQLIDMTYPENWRGRVKVEQSAVSKVYLDGKSKGIVTREYVKGAKSPGGMDTGTTWYAHGLSGVAVGPFQSKLQAVSCLLPRSLQV